MKAKDVLRNREEQIRRSTELLAQEVADWQTIQNYLTRRIAEIQLTETQQLKLQRYQFIYNQLVTGRYTDAEVCEMVMDVYAIQQTQALSDIRDAQELFNTAYSVNKLFEIKLQLSLNRAMLDKCDRTNNFKGYAALEKNRTKLLELLPDDDTSDADSFKGHENIIVMDTDALGIEPVPVEELAKLQAELQQKYGGNISLPGLPDNIADAEIVADGE